MNREMKLAVVSALLFGAVTFFGMSCSASAASEASVEDLHFLTGLSMGSSNYNGNVGSKMAWGVNGAVRFGQPFEAGIAYQKSQLAKDESTSISVDVSYLLLEGNYRMPVGGGFFTAGARAGTAKVQTNLDLGLISLGGESENKFAAGPKLGYQYPVSQHFELGAAADYTVVFTEEKIKSFGLLASAAYTF